MLANSNRMLMIIIILGIIMLIVSAIIAVMLANSFTKPLIAVNRAIDRLSNGEFEKLKDKKLISRKDEFGDIVRHINLLTDKIAGDSVKAATTDAKFMQGLIAKLAEQMAKEGEVVVEAKDAEALKKYFAANAKGLLEKGVKIAEVKGIKTDFTIQPAKGGYKLAFGDAEFIAYFKEMLRPQLVEELF